MFRARVCSTFQTGTDPDGVEINVEGGDVTSNASAAIRSTLSLTTVGTAWPREADDLLAPYGNEIYVERGIEFGNGQREWVGLGFYRVETPEQEAVPKGAISISASDRMSGIIDARFLAPRQFPSTATRGDVVEALILEVYPSAVIEWDDAGLRDGLLGRTIIAERDRAQTLRELVTSLGKLGYWRYDGVFVVRSAATITGPPSWTVDGGTNGVLTKMSRGITREGIYNVVVATGEAEDPNPPPYAFVADLNPASPTYYHGPFGPVPRFYASSFITTTEQARGAAETLLRQSLGLPYQVNLQAIANAGLEPDDVIKVRYPDGFLSHGTEVHVADTVTIPLDVATPITAKCRKQYGELIGDVTE